MDISLDISPIPGRQEQAHRTQKQAVFTRTLGLNELSYFLPSRANGLNDICSGAEISVPTGFLSEARICLAWALMRLRNPLCASRVEMPPGQYDAAKFVYTSPPDPVAALQEAASNISFSDGVTLNDAIEEFLSGPRTLTPFKLSHLRVLRQPTGSLAGSPDREIVGMLWMGAHYTTGGTGIHAAYNEFYTLLGSHLSEYELSQLLLSDWAKRWDRGKPMEAAVFKAPSDATIGVPKGRLQAAALALDRELIKANDIGGHVFPRVKPVRARHEVWEVYIDPSNSTRFTKRCKERGVTVSNAIFAASNFAWIRTQRAIRQREGRSDDREPEKHPMLIYTALDMKTQEAKLSPDTPRGENNIALSLGYLNIVLPSFIPHADSKTSRSRQVAAQAALEEAVFWHRARDIRNQFQRFCQSPWFAKRIVAVHQERAERAKRFAREDDAGNPDLQYAAWDRSRQTPPSKTSNSAPSTSPSLATPNVSQVLAKNGLGPSPLLPSPPSAALMGISLTGDLDRVYSHNYGPIEIERMSCFNRTGTGGMLLVGRTIGGVMNIALRADAATIQRDVLDEFWVNFERCLHEYMIGDVSVPEVQARM